MKRRKSNLDTNHKCQGYQPKMSIIPFFCMLSNQYLQIQRKLDGEIATGIEDADSARTGVLVGIL